MLLQDLVEIFCRYLAGLPSKTTYWTDAPHRKSWNVVRIFDVDGWAPVMALPAVATTAAKLMAAATAAAVLMATCTAAAWARAAKALDQTAFSSRLRGLGSTAALKAAANAARTNTVRRRGRHKKIHC